ncbi:hypothetical protein Moror_4636 [Moniliophthora roreri MCA 2997]|uniref:BTB domain-containing protein n=1 Tax=Moniliophthora roreri (strain MCA 2997) TaxID=1381753 RepID=V2XHN9_MONRO|nr:hypothetical protein Moror_4636 [Moniliophthora roreri MCA 2997]
MLVCEAIENCQIPVDIILQSSDGILLGSHTKNLSVFNEAFPNVDSVTHWKGDIVTLSETAAVLLLLLQFSHNAALPDISHMGLDALLAFFEAADKYGNNIALQACGAMIEKHTEKLSPELSLRFLCYKLSRDELENVDYLVRRSMQLPLHEALGHLRDHPNACINYAIYSDKWKQCMTHYQSIIETGSGEWLSLSNLSEFKDTSVRIQKVAARTLFMQLKEQTPLSMSSLEDAIQIAERISPGFQSRCAPNGWVSSMKAIVKGYPTWKEMQALIDNRS